MLQIVLYISMFNFPLTCTFKFAYKACLLFLFLNSLTKGNADANFIYPFNSTSQLDDLTQRYNSTRSFNSTVQFKSRAQWKSNRRFDSMQSSALRCNCAASPATNWIKSSNWNGCNRRIKLNQRIVSLNRIVEWRV